MTVNPAPTAISMADLLWARADDDHAALLFEGSRWTWREFVEEAEARARMLLGLRRPGPWHVGLLMDNSPEYLFLTAGAALCGATVVGINPTRRGQELLADVRTTDCQLVITDPARAELLSGLDLGGVDVLEVGDVEYDGALDGAPQVLGDPPPADHTLLLLFTSGSTGAPKAVVCSSARLAMIAQLNTHGLTREDVAYNAMPLFHGNAFMAAWAPIVAVGGTFALRPRFSASQFLPDVLEFGATFFNYVGRALAYVLAQPESADERRTRLRLGFGTEASTRDRREFERRFGCRIVESYGSSEGVCSIVRTPETPDGALGKPVEAMGLEIVDERGRACAVAELSDDGVLLNERDAIGEIVVRGGATRFEGYYNNPEAESEKLRDGDYWTGDLAYQDAHGNYWFAGRTADWIRVDSENLATAPIERLLGRAPGLIAAVVYGVPDPRTGDQVMATLLLEEGRTFDPEEFSRFLEEQQDLGTKWRPKLIRVASDVPLTGSGKSDKAALRRQAWHTDDAVHEWSGTEYRPLTHARLSELAREFEHHGRLAVLPRP